MRILGYKIAGYEYDYDTHKWTQLSQNNSHEVKYNSQGFYDLKDTIQKEVLWEDLSTKEQGEQIFGLGEDALKNVTDRDINYEPYGIIQAATNSDGTHNSAGTAIGASQEFFHHLDEDTWAPGGQQDLTEYEYLYEETLEKIVTIRTLGAEIGGQIASFFADDNFASQLLSRTIGTTVGAFITEPIVELILPKKNIKALSLSSTLLSNLVSNTLALGAGELAENIIDTLEIDNTLAQIGVNTLTQAVVNYAFTSIAVEFWLLRWFYGTAFK